MVTFFQQAPRSFTVYWQAKQALIELSSFFYEELFRDLEEKSAAINNVLPGFKGEKETKNDPCFVLVNWLVKILTDPEKTLPEKAAAAITKVTSIDSEVNDRCNHLAGVEVVSESELSLEKAKSDFIDSSIKLTNAAVSYLSIASINASY